MTKTLAIIPARYESSRLPGKPMIEVGGKTIIQRVYEQTSKAKNVDKVVIATDSPIIFEHSQQIGAEAIMTAVEHRNGTERCAEVVEKIGRDFNVILNIQGDEPLIAPSQIDLLAGLFEDKTIQIGTLVKKIEKLEHLLDPTEAKVIFNSQQEAIYFSRSPIPFLKGVAQEEWVLHHDYYKHLGIYGFRAEIMPEIIKLPLSTLEQCEGLEQLRWLEKYKIKIGITDIDTFAIDNDNDLERLRKLFEHR